MGSAGLGVGEPSSDIRKGQAWETVLHAHGLGASIGDSYRAEGLDAPAEQMGRPRVVLVDRETGSCTTAWRVVHSLSGKSSRQDAKVGRGVNQISSNRGLLEWREVLVRSSTLMAARRLLGFLAPAPAVGGLPISNVPRPPVGDSRATVLWPRRHCGGGDGMVDMVCGSAGGGAGAVALVGCGGQPSDGEG